ncbi:unnamed protein product [Knipowitschia caucasica]|uniref:Uncharacterized protein n=1 Tax=Knipowitschia caucasica TaxID=637954 RepID=A0AAV2LBZ1_KNICA
MCRCQRGLYWQSESGPKHSPASSYKPYKDQGPCVYAPTSILSPCLPLALGNPTSKKTLRPNREITGVDQQSPPTFRDSHHRRSLLQAFLT